MRGKGLLVGLFSVLLPLFASANNEGDQVRGPGDYVKIEVCGKLVRSEIPYQHYSIEVLGSFYSDAVAAPPQSHSKLLVRLERAEDKNRKLDERLVSLEGKLVIVKGPLDWRNIDRHLEFYQGQWVVSKTTEIDEDGLRIYINSENQIEPLVPK
jgi:hypothetical protein